ncbi:hypothetical protein, partial [Yersinia rohdei]|uniref:hypothetical protein n=1 Tax=Yersinia rohdei TaxID=29485 RepID=UPI0025AB4808
AHRDLFLCCLAVTPMTSGIPFALKATAVLAALTHPNHILISAHRDLFLCCLAVTPMTSGIPFALKATAVLAALPHLTH